MWRVRVGEVISPLPRGIPTDCRQNIEGQRNAVVVGGFVILFMYLAIEFFFSRHTEKVSRGRLSACFVCFFRILKYDHRVLT